MHIAELIAVWITAVATVLIALAALKQLPLIAHQVSSLTEQIRQSRDAELNAERRLREWETLKACDRYDVDPILDAAMLRIYNGSQKGVNYRSPEVEKRDVICVLNYLDSLATGVHQNLYIEEIIKDHMSLVIRKHVRDLLEAGIVEKEGYHNLLRLYERWSEQDVNYQSHKSS
jgi:hypothetical protein